MRAKIDRETETKLKTRLLKFLKGNAATVQVARDGHTALIERKDSRRLKLPLNMINVALSDGLILQRGKRKCGELLEVQLSPEGEAKAKAKARAKVAKDAPVTPNRAEGSTETKATGLIVNDGSPLARLYFFGQKAGRSWLSKEEFHAGERLRVDFEKSQVSPSLGIDWDAFGMPRARSGAGGQASASDFADAARKRLTQALAIVGPEMAGLLLDVCCFLKGLERVESERGWPRRSAKLLLKVALASLDRHYNPQPVQVANHLRAWSAEPASDEISA